MEMYEKEPNSTQRMLLKRKLNKLQGKIDDIRRRSIPKEV